jgi:hypothetical protein
MEYSVTVFFGSSIPVFYINWFTSYTLSVLSALSCGTKGFSWRECWEIHYVQLQGNRRSKLCLTCYVIFIYLFIFLDICVGSDCK